MSRLLLPCLCAALAALPFSACDRRQAALPPPPTNPPPPRLPVGPPDLYQQYSGEKALAEVGKQVAFGPRVSGSPTLEKARGHIIGSLQGSGWEVERQSFVLTPVPGRGAFSYVNLVARFPATPGQPAATNTQRILIGSHYDTKYLPGQNFVGANDAGSSTGGLLELARVLATAPTLAQQIELVFFDGEEALVEFGQAEIGPDGLVGSRHYAGELRATNRAPQFRCALVWDMIGDKNLKLTLPADTPVALTTGLFNAADQLGVRQHLGMFPEPILDDHEPIARIARIPAIDLIDFDYPPWHTGADTMDKLSADSLRVIGQLTIVFLQQELAK